MKLLLFISKASFFWYCPSKLLIGDADVCCALSGDVVTSVLASGMGLVGVICLSTVFSVTLRLYFWYKSSSEFALP